MLAGCRIEGVAGRGGMGIVYRATQLGLDRPVALKVIDGRQAQDPELRARFALESRLAASIDHPNVVPVHAAGEEDGRLYLVMRYVAGTDLHAELRRCGRLSPRRAVDVVAQVAAGLDAAHAAGLVHRDVKPANVLLADSHAYLGDFGLTRLEGSDERITETGAWVGTVDYMSPEHLRGAHCDARSDVYALGCLLFAALTGRPPLHRATVPATMAAHIHEPPPAPSSLAPMPRELDAVVARALAKDPAQRYWSAGDLGAAALAAAEGEPPTGVERTVARGAAAPRTEVTSVLAPPTAETSALASRVSPEPQTRWIPPLLDERPVARRPRRVRTAVLAVLTALVAAGVAVAAGLTGASADPGASRSGAPLTAGDVRATVGAFAGAVGARDDAALGRVLGRDVKRVFPADAQRGRAQVLSAYRGQFRTGGITGYEVDVGSVSGGAAGRAEGTYVLHRDGRPDVSGRIVFGVVRERGRPRIGLIAAAPR